MGLAAIQRLAQGAWPQLDTLDLSNNLIDKVAMSALTLGKWPLLGRLILDENCLLTPAAITCISEASNWVLLSNLSLQGAELGTAGGCAAAQLHRRLHCLDLSANGVRIEGISQLVLVPWPCLLNLTLSSNQLGADAMAALAQASLPKLQLLDLEDNSLDTAAIWELIKCGFPSLQRLLLDYNCLDDAAATSLAKGQWPLLEDLSLAGSNIKARGVKVLTRGDWPRLSGLTLDSRAVCKATLRALALVSDAVLNLDPTDSCEHTFVDRDLSGLYSVIWPQLHDVCFVDVSMRGSLSSRYL